MSIHDPGPWRIVIPVKARHLAKSRLHPPAGTSRAELAHAFALDTIEAAARSVAPGNLVVVTTDAPTADFAHSLDALVVADPTAAPARDAAPASDPLNSAIQVGLDQVLAQLGDGPVAVLLGDVPALTPAALDAALAQCARYERAFVPDAAGTGTVLLTSLQCSLLTPRFGRSSASAHEQQGHRRLTPDLPALRTDVDDDVSLREVAAMGVGAHTRAVLDASGRRAG